MWLGFKGLRNVFAHGHSSIFILIFLGYMVVGLGSMAFHTTLKCQFSCLSSPSRVPLTLRLSPCVYAFKCLVSDPTYRR